ncbi:phage tail protein [Lactiplantibacillus plantarum]|nr:phage tail protein [Lactiplantibacillus plantarum]
MQNSANNKFTSAANAASQAAIATSQAFSAADSASKEAQGISNRVDSSMSVQSQATAKAQSTADSAFSQAKTAIDNGNATSQAVTALKDGSTLTIAQLGNGLAEKVSNSEYASYKIHTASQIGEMVTDGAFSAYQQITKNLISSKVSNGDFSSYKDETAKEISNKVESKDFKNYQKQTADAFKRTISSADYKSDMKQTSDMFSNKISDAINGLTISNRNLALGTATAFKMNGNNTDNQLQGAYKFSKVIPHETVVTVTFDVSSSTGVGDFTMQFNGSDPASSWQPIYNSNLVNGTKHVSATITTDSDHLSICPRLDHATGDVTFSNFIISESSKEVSWTPAPEDQATQSEFTQLKDNIDLRVKKDGLISEINVQARHTLISSGGQLTLSGKNINFDTDNPVIIPSANIDTLLVDKKLTAADISANTFTTNNGTFTVEKDGAITAKNMTLTGGTLTTPIINSSTINGGTLNMQTDGLINSPYNGIVQTADQFYHPWKLNTGQLTIGQGYITSVSSGTRSINGVPKQFNSLQGTLSASYLKFTNDFGSRNYIDADMLTCSSPTNNGTMVAINATGNIGINAGDPGAPALTISSGHIDASSSSSYGVFGAITLGYNAHTINSDSSLFFESGHGSGNPGINIWAKGFQSLSSRLSTKRQVRLLDDEHSNGLLLGADTATFKYNQDTNADNPNEGVIIDDVNTVKKYNLPDELITRDGKAPTDLMSFIARIISQNKYQARLIENLQIRLRKVEINNE